MNREIEQLVGSFVGDLEKLFEKKSADHINEILVGLGGKKRVSVKGFLHTGKRTPEELDEMQANLFAYLKKNPGQRCEEIAKGMKVDTSDLALPLKKLGKKLKWEGVARGRRYWARG